MQVNLIDDFEIDCKNCHVEIGPVCEISVIPIAGNFIIMREVVPLTEWFSKRTEQIVVADC